MGTMAIGNFYKQGRGELWVPWLGTIGKGTGGWGTKIWSVWWRRRVGILIHSCSKAMDVHKKQNQILDAEERRMAQEGPVV